MDHNPHLLDSLKAWLVSADGTARLNTLARRADLEAPAGSSLALIWPYPTIDGLTPEARAEQCDDIAQDFLVHLLTVLPDQLARRPDLVLDLRQGRWHQLLDCLWRHFINQWREKARGHKDNPRGYLYRRARMTISASAAFVTIPCGGKGLAYAPARPPPASDLVLPSDCISHAAISLPPIPRGASPAAVLFSQEYLAAAAAQFHRQLPRDEAGPRHVAVRDLITTLAHHHPWLNRPLPEQLDEAADPVAAATPSPPERLEYLTDLSSMAVLAAQATAGLSPDECRVLLWKLGEHKMSLRAMARELGLKNEGAADRIWRGTQKKLQRFVACCPGPDWRELPDEVLQAFVDGVRRQCEKTSGLPVSEGK